MTVGEYLQAKYQRLNGIVSLTRVEAKILGIAYPLKSGWYVENRGRLITESQGRQLQEAMTHKKGKKAKKYAKVAVRFLNGQEPTIKDLGESERQHLKSILLA
jgi:hypothetical protein